MKAVGLTRPTIEAKVIIHILLFFLLEHRLDCVKVETARTMEPLLFSTLFSEISPRIQSEFFLNLFCKTKHAHCTQILRPVASMPLAVKRELSNLIRQHVEKQFE